MGWPGIRRASSANKLNNGPTDMAAGSGREIDVFSGSGTIYSWFDVHSDACQIFGNKVNQGGRFASVKNINSAEGGQGFFVDQASTTLTDCWFENMEYATDGGGVVAVSQVLSTWSHSGVRKSTFYDQPFNMRTDAAGAAKFNPDIYCEISNNSFFSFAWQTGIQDTDLVMDKNNVRSGVNPTGSTNGSTATTNLYVNAPTDLSPVTGGNLLVSGSYLGARSPTNWNV